MSRGARARARERRTFGILTLTLHPKNAKKITLRLIALNRNSIFNFRRIERQGGGTQSERRRVCVCDTAILQCVEIFCVWVRGRLNWQLLRTSPSVMPSVNDVLIWFFVMSVELATDVHQRSVLGVVASPFLWHDLNRQICHRLDVRDVAAFLPFFFPQIRFKHFYSKFPISRPSLREKPSARLSPQLPRRRESK